MRLAPQELDIRPDEGFAPERDIFKRKPFGDQLTRIVCGLEGPAVLLLDAQWGTGKTTFVKMWLGELAKAGVPTIYFDAFINDYHDDAFLTVAGEIVARAEELKPKSKRALRQFKDRAVGVAKALGRASVRIGIRTASAGLLTGDELIEGVKIAADEAKAVGDETAKAIDELLKERLESHKADRQVFDQFKDALGDLASALSAPARNSGPAENPATPLVFVIDELDRCRPSFALELLEKIKHFFSVPGVIFILVSSLSQLEAAVHFAYGDIDTRTYLDKFYHLRLLFPTTSLDRPDTTSTYLQHLQTEFATGNRNVLQIIQKFCRIRPLPLRTLQRIFLYTSIVEMTIPQNALKVPAFIGVLGVIRVLEPDLYGLCRSGTVTFDQVDQLMRFAHWRADHDVQKRDRVGEDTENWWRYALGNLSDDGLAARYSQNLAGFSREDPSRLIPHFCEIIDGFSLPSPNG